MALLGWTVGRNLSIDIRWATTNAAEIRRHAAELAALTPDVILATGDSTIPPLQQATRIVPIVFPIAGDPIAAGFVDSLARQRRTVLERPRWRALHQGKHARMLGVAKEAGAVAVHCDSGSRS
jgi:putative ABC transport system substrate-binding protein